MTDTARMRDARLEQELPPPAGLDAACAQRAFGDLAEYRGQPRERIREEYWRYRAGDDVAAQERVARATTEADVLAYYQATPHYLYELSYWEGSHDKAGWHRVVAMACKQHRLRRVLDYGGRAGGTALYLRRQGIKSSYADVPGKTFDYAAWRFRRHGYDVPMYSVLEPSWRAEPFDAVIAWDVLEHLFDLDGAIRRIASVLRPGGWFLNKSTFANAGEQHLHIHLAQHARYQDLTLFNQLLASHRLRFIGQLKPSRASRLLRKLGFRSAVVGLAMPPKLKHGGNFLVHQTA